MDEFGGAVHCHSTDTVSVACRSYNVPTDED